MTQLLSHPFKVFFPKPSTITQTKRAKNKSQYYCSQVKVVSQFFPLTSTDLSSDVIFVFILLW